MEISSICSEILRGYSILDSSFGQVCVRHFGAMDLAFFNSKRAELIKEGRKRGLSSLEDREKEIIQQELWAEDKNKDIKVRKDFIKNLYKTKGLQTSQKTIDIYIKQIQEEEKKLAEIENEKSNIIGLTIENWAEKKISELYIYKSFYKNLTFTEPFFTEEEFDEIEEIKIYSLYSEFNVLSSRFSSESLKKVALNAHFYNLFVVSDGNIFSFYGKPIINLTNYQVEVFRHAIYFKSIFTNSSAAPPEDVMDDPEKLINWFNLSRNIQKAVEKGGSVVGASAEDYKRAGIKENVVDVGAEMKARGKSSLDMEDLLKMQLGR